MHYTWNIIGHQKQLEELEHDFQTHTMGHAYLFSGTGSIGKFTIAKQLACVMQCQKHFCKTCPACIQIGKGSHIDTIQIDDDGESIKIEQIRDILARLNMTGQSAYKLFLIKNIERLTDEAANCLLKTLEEPPNQTVFIFTTQNFQELLPTITSRMRIIKFLPVPEYMLMKELIARFPEMNRSSFEEIILLSLGKPGRAIDLINNSEKLQFFRELYRTVEKMCEDESIAERFITASELSKDTPILKAFLDMLMYYLRNKLLQAPAEGKRYIPLLISIQDIKNLLKRNVNAKLLIENLILKLHPSTHV